MVLDDYNLDVGEENEYVACKNRHGTFNGFNVTPETRTNKKVDPSLNTTVKNRWKKKYTLIHNVAFENFCG